MNFINKSMAGNDAALSATFPVDFLKVRFRVVQSGGK